MASNDDTYAITSHASLECSATGGLGHPEALAVYTLARVGYANDKYVVTCPCGSETIRLTYAKRKKV